MDITSQLLLANKPLGDPYFDNVVLYLKGDGTNGSTNIIDSSNSAKTVSVFGNARISTAQSKYGGSSLYFDGNTLSKCYINHSPDFNIEGNYTFECWFYSSSTDFRYLLNKGYNGSLLDLFSIYMYNNNTINANIRQSNNTFIGQTFQINLNTFYHVAFSVGGTNWYLAVNGIIVHQGTFDGTFANNTRDLVIGGLLGEASNRTFIGYIDSLRITKGVARYTSNFNPETDTYLAY